MALACRNYRRYEFTTKYNIGADFGENQQRTGTCWSFQLSVLESELMRLRQGRSGPFRILHMVRTHFTDQARNYVSSDRAKPTFSEEGSTTM